MVDFDSFLRWAEDKFDSVVVKGPEIKLNSIFAPDRHHHLCCNPNGGKHKRPDGCYHCWKTGEYGTLVGLVMQVEGCTYQEAKEILDGGISIRDLEDRLEEFFANQENKEIPPPENKLTLPEDTYPITELSPLHRGVAESYLKNRLLPIESFYYCIAGDYRNRIIIPYYDREEKLIYWNARHVGQSKLRYRGPEKTCGVGKSDVLYAPKWPCFGSKVYLTEGEFDALTLQICGFNGMACGGKELDDKQIELLRGYRICLGLDNDATVDEAKAPGLTGMLNMGNKLLAAHFVVSFVRPPRVFKDWNKMLVSLRNPEIISEYIRLCEKPFEPAYR